MRVYTGQTRSRRAIALCDRLGLGECTNRGELPPRRTASGWFMDCGAFIDWRAGRAFDFVRWERDLRYVAYRIEAGVLPAPDFIVMPDIVGGGAASLTRSVEELASVPPELPVRYLVVQEGMAPADVAEVLPRFSGVFIGGASDGVEARDRAGLDRAGACARCPVPHRPDRHARAARARAADGRRQRRQLSTPVGARSARGVRARRRRCRRAEGRVIPVAPPASRVVLGPGDQACCLLLEVAGRRSRSGTRHTVRGVARVRVESVEGDVYSVVVLAASGASASISPTRGPRSTRPGATSGGRSSSWWCSCGVADDRRTRPAVDGAPPVAPAGGRADPDRADLCAACATALRHPTTIRTLADAARRFVARAWCADELNRRARRARLAMEYPPWLLTDTAASSERR